MKTCERTGKPIIELSHSGLATFASCPKRFAFRKVVVNFFEERGNSDAAAVGTALHEGIQHFMVHRDVEQAIEQMARHHPIELQPNSSAAQYSLEAAVWTLQHCLTDSELPGYDLVYFKDADGKDTPAVEVAFMVEIEVGPIMFHLRGFVDLILRNPMNGRFLPIDIKTMTPTAERTLGEKYYYDYQATSYAMPLNALLGNSGDFDTGIFGVILSDKEPKSSFPIYHRTQRDVEDYQYYLLDKCQQIVHYYQQGRFPRHPNSCIQFNRVCQYHSVCNAVNLRDMQLAVNPSMKTGDAGRPFTPLFTVRMEGM